MRVSIASLIAMASILLVSNTHAAVQLVPSSTLIAVNDSFVVNVQTSGLVNIDSASVQLTYDPNIVRLDGITLGGGAAFCDLVIKDVDANDGFVDGIFAMTHRPTGERCPALNGDFVAFQIQMTAMAAGDSVLLLGQSQARPGFGWTSENNPGQILLLAETEAPPLLFTVDPLPDTDADGVPDGVDNCILVSNADQRDTNADGYGNMCDGDLNNDGRTNTIDLNLYKAAHRSRVGDAQYDPDADFNGDNTINTIDLNIYKGLHRKVPGPSGLVP